MISRSGGERLMDQGLRYRKEDTVVENRAGQEGEGRLFASVAMWLRRQIESQLPESQRGMHAPNLDRGRLAEDARAALFVLVHELVGEVKRAIPAPATTKVPVGLTRRLTVMDNLSPCERCQKVTRVATLDYREGVLHHVECETCSPEFNTTEGESHGRPS